MSKNPSFSELAGRAKNPSIREAGEQLRGELRTLADRAISAQKEASEIRAFILRCAGQLAESGVVRSGDAPPVHPQRIRLKDVAHERCDPDPVNADREPDAQ